MHGDRIHQQVALVRAEDVDVELDCLPDAVELDPERAAKLRAALQKVVERMSLPPSAARHGSFERSVSVSFTSDDVDVLADAELRGLVNDSVAASGIGHRGVYALMHEVVHRALDEGRLVIATDGLDEQASDATQALENPPTIWGRVPARNPDFVGRLELLGQLASRLVAPQLEPRAVLKAFLLRLIKLSRRSSAARQSAAERARLASRSTAASSDMPPAGIVLLSTRAPRGPNAPRTASTQVISGEQVAAA